MINNEVAQHSPVAVSGKSSTLWQAGVSMINSEVAPLTPMAGSG